MYFFVITGGGTAAIGNMLSKGGASKWFSGAYIPYAKELFDQLVGGEPEKYVSLEAVFSLIQGASIKFDMNSNIVACTSRLRDNSKPPFYPDGTKRLNCAYIATANFDGTDIRYKYVEFDSEKTREEQEEELSNMLMSVVSKEFIPDVTILGDIFDSTLEHKVIFPGSFNPPTKNHFDIANIVHNKTGQKPFFEISICNRDKGSISYPEALRRAKLINDGGFPVIIDHNPYFFDKVNGLKDIADKISFIVGYDTLARINRDHSEEELKFFEKNNVDFFVVQRENVDPFINKMDKVCKIIPDYVDDGWSSTKERELCVGS